MNSGSCTPAYLRIHVREGVERKKLPDLVEEESISMGQGAGVSQVRMQVRLDIQAVMSAAMLVAADMLNEQAMMDTLAVAVAVVHIAAR